MFYKFTYYIKAYYSHLFNKNVVKFLFWRLDKQIANTIETLPKL